jgi:hypothetical protein
LNLLGTARRKRLDVQDGGGASIQQQAHIGGVDAELDHRQNVAAFDGDFVREGIGLRARSNRVERPCQSQPEQNGDATHHHVE